MSFFSNHSHSHSSITTATTTTTTDSHPNNSYSAIASSGGSRQRTSTSNLRHTSSKLSLSISSPPLERERALTSQSATTAHPHNNHTHSHNGGANGLYSTPTTVAGSGTGTASVKGSSSVFTTYSSPTPLRSTWVFWFRQQAKAPGKTINTNYEEGIKKVAAFSSVESFWSLQTHLHPPSSLAPTTDYLLFHSGVRRPVWEDPLNQYGGKWIIRLRKGISDRLWEDLVLAVIGDQFDVEDGICGCVLSVRGGEDIISVWNRDDKDAEAKGRIRDGIRKALALPKETIMEYKSNNDSMNDKSSFRTTSSTNIVTLGSLAQGQNVPSTPS